MATTTYILTIDEDDLTEDLRTLLESKGATLHEQPIEQLELPEAEARVILDRMKEAENGKRFKPIDKVEAQALVYLKKKRADG